MFLIVNVRCLIDKIKQILNSAKNFQQITNFQIYENVEFFTMFDNNFYTNKKVRIRGRLSRGNQFNLRCNTSPYIVIQQVILKV